MGRKTLILLIILSIACDVDAPPTESGPTYYADVRPILDQTCARCHTDGALAFSLDEATTAQGMASAIATAVTEGRMPPAAPDPACREYTDSARFTLTDEQRATLDAWASAGAPLGEVSDAPGPRDATLEHLPTYDVELRSAQPYTPSFPSDSNDYRCFLIDVGNTDTTWITGMQALVDNMSIVHHVVLFQPEGTSDLWGQGDPHDGFSCSGLGQGNWTVLGAWGPGANPTVMPEGMGIRLEPASQFVLQMHYFNSFDGADREIDQSGYGLTFTDSVSWEVISLPAGPTSFTIDADDAAGTARDMYVWSGEALILGVWPHMHLLGSAFEEKVHHADDDTDDCLLRMNEWDFTNQVSANFLEPVSIRDGDRLSVSCTWDNSAENPYQYRDPPVAVAFGEGTQDEMCFGFTLVATEVE